MPKRIIDRKGIPVLGRIERAAQLVEWSQKHKEGTQYTIDLPQGLRLGAIAAGSEPKLHIHWNPVKFREWVKTLGAMPERLVLVQYGIAITIEASRIQLQLLGAGRTSQTLWDTERRFCREESRPDARPVFWNLGMLRFSVEGIFYYDTPEAQKEIEEASAIAIVDAVPQATRVSEANVNVVPIKRPGELLPDQTVKVGADVMPLQGGLVPPDEYGLL